MMNAEKKSSEVSYRYGLSTEARNLLIFSGLPLVDGFYVAFLTTGMWRDYTTAIMFGLTAFSGAGCLIAAMALQGSLRQRVREVSRVYLLIAFGALIGLLSQPMLEKAIPTEMSLFTGVFLLGLGLATTRNKALTWLASKTAFDGIVRAMLAIIVVRGIVLGVKPQISLNVAAIIPVMLSVSVAYTLTLLGTLPGQMFAQDLSNTSPLSYGAGFSLVMMAGKVLGFSVPFWVVIGPFIGGLILIVIRALVSRRISLRYSYPQKALPE